MAAKPPNFSGIERDFNVKKLSLLGFVMLLGLAACGKKDGEAGGDGGGGGGGGGAVKGSCETHTKCTEYTKGGLGLELVKGLCEGMKDPTFKSVWSEGKPCAHDKALGTCTLAESGETYYYLPETDGDQIFGYKNVDDAKKDCESELTKGKFAATPGFKFPPLKVKGVCVSAKFKTCEEALALHGGIMKSNCESSEGKWTEGEGKCPTENVVGTCEAEDGKIFYTAGYGYEKPAPYVTVKKKAEDDCKTHGDKAKYTEAAGAADMKAAGAAPAAKGAPTAAPKGGLPGKPAPKK
jgi:hypothetical protein